MVDRITYGDKEPGDLFTADDADMIANAVNGLGTAADANTGTAAGNVPVLGTDGRLPASVLPDVILGEAGGDVVGPGTATDGLPVLFDGGTGKVIKAGAAAQLVPAGTDGYWLTLASGAPTWVAASSLATALGALTGASRIPYTGVHNLDSAGAGALYGPAHVAALSMTAGQFMRANAGLTALEAVSLGTAAFIDALPSGAPATASSSAGAITLDFTGRAVIQTTTTEAITAITFAGIAAYATVVWRVKQTTARNVAFPAGTKIAGGALTYTGVANSTVNFIIYNDNGTYEVVVGDELVVGS